MATFLYGIYVLISRPHHDERLGVWRPYVSISWDGNKFNYYQLNNLDKKFETEDEAIAYGFLAASNWVDEQRTKG